MKTAVRLALVALTCAAALVIAPAAGAQPITGLDTSNRLFTFDSATPNVTSAPKPITGLGSDKLIAIDRNPQDGHLYALSDQSRMYRIDESTGAATQVGPTFSVPLTSANADIDFDPQTGNARITTETDQNLVWSPVGGSEVAQSPLAYAPGDPNVAFNPALTGIAFTKNAPGTVDSNIVGYDYAHDKVVRLGTPDPPSDGKLHTVTSAGVIAQNQRVGLDAGPDGTIFALLRVGTITTLYTVSQINGSLSNPKTVGTGADTTVDIATETVTNDISFGKATYDVSESGRDVTVTVKRSQALGQASAMLHTAQGSALPGSDYYEAALPVVFEPGQTSTSVKVKIRSDLIHEAPVETFSATLGLPQGGHANFVDPQQAVVRIHDDDSGPPPATALTALTTANQLIRFSSATPGTTSAPRAVTGLPAGEHLVAIDRRPSTGQLYAISKESRLYRINEGTGAATQVGPKFPTPLTGTAWGIDFNPVVDRIRVVSDDRQNLRLDPDTGAEIVDPALHYAPGDPALPKAPVVADVAYTNDVPGATGTTLFGYEYLQDHLVQIGTPFSSNSGSVSTIAPSNVSSQGAGAVGLDVAPDGRAWATLHEGALTRLNLVDLKTGLASNAGEIGTGTDAIADIAADPVINAVRFSRSRYAGTEESRSATVVVTRSQSLGAASVAFKTSDGSAKAGADYKPVSGTLTFAPGQKSRTVTVPVVDDAVREGREAFKVTLANPKGGVASLASPSAANVRISDDGPPVVKTCGARRQPVLEQRGVLVCLVSSKDALARVTGSLKVRGVAKAFKLRAARRSVVHGQRAKLRLKLSRAARVALLGHRRATASIRIRVRDAHGLERRVTRKVKAR